MKKPAPRKKPADWLDSAGRCGMLTVTPGPAPRHRRGAGNDGEFSKGLYLGRGLCARQLTFSLPQGVRTFSHALALDEMDKLDFVGLNHYHGIPARMGPQGPEPVPFPVGGPSTAIGWPITPEALGWGPASCISAIRNPSISARTACPAGTRSFWTARSTIPSTSTSSPGIFGPWTGHCRRDRRAGILSLVPYRQF